MTTSAVWPKVSPIPVAAVSQWRRLAAAVQHTEPPCSADPELWFSHHPDDTEAAVYGCTRCHALIPCGAYADAAGETSGVWAGRDREPCRQPEGTA